MMNTNTANHSYQGADDALNESGGHQSQAYGYSSKLAYLRRPCLIVAKGIRWLPVFFIVSILVWSYYAYVVQLNLTYVDTIFEKVIFLTVYHIILIMYIWSYYKIVFTVPATVPSSWILSTAMLEQLTAAKTEEEWKGLLELFIVEMQLPVVQRSIQGAVRYCEKCTQVKPDRSHHCGVCEKCILKMDHHCPWVNNCVAFNNYKFFILFLGYALLYCVWIDVTTFKYFIRFWTGDLPDNDGGGRYHILFLFFVGVMFSISVSSLFWYHIYLTLQNRSTLEQFRAPIFRGGTDERGWSLGKTNNFQEVFGDRKLLWFIPVETHLGDGLLFPTRLQPEAGGGCSVGVNGTGGPYRTLSDASTSRAPPAATDSYSVDLIDETNHHAAPEKVATEIVMDGLNTHKVRVAREPGTLAGVSVQ